MQQGLGQIIDLRFCEGLAKGLTDSGVQLRKFAIGQAMDFGEDGLGIGHTCGFT